MTKFDDIKKTLPPAQALLPDAPAIANEMRRHEDALALDAMKDRATRADGPPLDIATVLSRIESRFYPRITMPRAPSTAVYQGDGDGGLRVAYSAGPIPVDFTLASAALNRGESPPIMGNLRFTFAPDGAR